MSMTQRNIHDFNPNCSLLDIPALKMLASCFRIHQLVFVGGCVRDTIMGIEPKDIDLATSATPEQMIEIFEDMDIQYIATGLQHGTLTAVLDGESYEITTFRIDKETDGRHATVEYTRDINEDLMRRDLTINAIAMDFYGDLIDPFNGVNDIMNGVVRFVGNAEDRITEDYLRILRYFRFLGRFSSKLALIDKMSEAYAAIEAHKDGLKQISVERIWMEVAKIISGPRADDVVTMMVSSGVWKTIGLPTNPIENAFGTFAFADRHMVKNPATIMGWFLTDASKVEELADSWKWSNEDRNRAMFVASQVFVPQYDGSGSLNQFKEMLVNDVPFDWVMDVATLHGHDTKELSEWTIPTLPVTGKDLIAAGVEPGPDFGRILSEIKKRWVKSNYTLDKEALMCF